jgi:transcriptional regulator with XRE-family HTH domain
MEVAMAESLDWSQVQQLLETAGAEDNLASRLAGMRQRHGWSQDRLAAEMAKAGCPIPQSAISKIERPAAGGRRAITVDEALAFARVFNMSLHELVLPQDALAEVQALRDLAEGMEALADREEAVNRYNSIVNRLAERMEKEPRWAAIIKGELDRLHARHSAPEDLELLGHNLRWTFLIDVMDQHARATGIESWEIES